MKIEIGEYKTDVFPTNDEVKTLCQPGSENTCAWLGRGVNGWECLALNKPLSLLKRWERGETNAKRDGCDFVNNFDTFHNESGDYNPFVEDLEAIRRQQPINEKDQDRFQEHP